MMGRLLVSPTLLRIDGEVAKLSINMRRPAGMSSPELGAKLATALAAIQKSIDPAIRQPAEPYIGEPAMANTEGPLVSTLLEIYRRESGDSAAQPISIRGGTYARLFSGAVSFGPSLPGRPYRGHAPDEYVELGALELMNRAIFEAVLALDRVNVGVSSR
jgi:acetylornithine deacetylase/succinyl-diaminopimelate desuccinylase-like protein